MSQTQNDDRGNLLAVPTERHETHGLLPDPKQQEIKYTVISVDDHLVEPPHMFENRLPKKYQDLAPKLIPNDDGSEAWVFDGKTFGSCQFFSKYSPCPFEISCQVLYGSCKLRFNRRKKS